jgi:hypothetical protein
VWRICIIPTDADLPLEARRLAPLFFGEDEDSAATKRSTCAAVFSKTATDTKISRQNLCVTSRQAAVFDVHLRA